MPAEDIQPQSTPETSVTPDATTQSTSPEASSSDSFSFSGDELAKAFADAETANTETLTANTDTAVANTETVVANTVPLEANTDVAETFTSEKEKTAWEARVEKLRTTERAKVDEEYFGANGKYAWAKDVPAEDGGIAVGMLTELRNDPMAAADELVRTIASNESLKDQVIPWLCGLLGVDPKTLGQAAASTSNAPAPTAGSVKTTTGEGVYTDAEINAMLASVRAEATKEAVAAARKELDKDLGPIRKEREQKAAEERERAAYEANANQLRTVGKELSEIPGFNDHKPEIANALHEMLVKAGNPTDAATVSTLSYKAAMKVLSAKSAEIARKDAHKQLERKAGAGTLSPSATTQAGFDYDKATLAETLAYEASIRKG